MGCNVRDVVHWTSLLGVGVGGAASVGAWGGDSAGLSSGMWAGSDVRSVHVRVSSWDDGKSSRLVWELW